MRYVLLGLIMAFLFTGCEDKPPARTVFDPQLETLEKARAVEGQLQEAAKRRAKEVEASEGR